MTAAEEGYLERAELAALQGERLHSLLAAILPANRFYAEKFAALSAHDLDGLGDLPRLPFTTKAELLADQATHPPYGSVLTYPATRYRRLHQTSGTRGRPLRWLDTAESWQRLIGCWKTIFRIVDIREGERLFFPFSFGPFLGFWTAFEAAEQFG